MPNIGRPYLDHQTEEVQPASEHRLWVGAQTNKGIFTEPGGADVFLLTARASPNQVRVQHDNEEFRGTRSPAAQIQGVWPEAEFSAEGYLQPAGTLSAAATGVDAGDDPPQGDQMLRNFWGAVSLADTQNIHAITAVGTSTRDTTIFDIASASGFAVDDMIELLVHADNTNESGPADNEVRRITNIATNTITVLPGFSKEPIIGASADTIQGVRMYKPTKAWSAWLSGRILEGSIGKEMIDGKCGTFSVSLSPEEPIKISCDLTFLTLRQSGIDQVIGESGTDVIGTTDSPLDVADASKFAIGCFVDLKLIAVATDILTSTEVGAEVTNRDISSSPNTLSLIRGTTPAAATDLTAQTTASEESAGPYDVSTNVNLKFRVDGKQFVTFDVTSPTAPSTPTSATAAELIANLNTQLRLNQYYGFASEGRYAVTWGTAVFVDNAGTIEMYSKMFGSQSSIEVAAAASLSCDSELFTGAFAITAVEEIQIVPHEPAVTEQGVEGHGYTVLLNWGSYCMGVNSFSISGTNNPRVVREMKKTPNPLTIIAGKTRTYDISMELLQKQDAAAFKEDLDSKTERILHVQTIADAGDVVGWDFDLARILTVETGGDDEVATMSMTIGVRGASDDEAIMFFG